MRIHRRALLTAIALALLPAAGVPSQTFRKGGTELDAMRPVLLSPGQSYSIVVTEFLHHGEIGPEGHNVLVAAKHGERVPMRMLQIGPGDFCRLAFQPIKGQTEYDVFYGGEPPPEPGPPWTARDGLLLETRPFSNCNLTSLDAVRQAFRAAQAIGADYVENVRHACNPFLPGFAPFFSHYSGWLQIPADGTYGFMTSSQDCSFLLIDDKLVVAAPGRHGPARRALRGSRHDINLSAGPHKFDYYHAAAGGDAMMVAAWEVNPRDAKPERPVAIPSELFGTHAVGHVAAGHVTLRTAKQIPDFHVKIAGEVPLPDNDTPLLAVMFRDASPAALSTGGKVLWEFGDGQHSDKANVDHVYLHPGLYAVKLSWKHGSNKVETVNRIYVDRPTLTAKDKPNTLDEYLAILRTYDPHTLDAAGLLQLALTYQSKALDVQSKADELEQEEKTKQQDPNRKQPDRKAALRDKKAVEKPTAEVERYLTLAVETGNAAFVEESAARGDNDLRKLIELVGPMAREQLGNTEAAFQLWKGAAQRISAADIKAECEAQAADIAINDLLSAAAAKGLLESAAARLGNRKGSAAAGRLQRAWGDYYALTGDGKAARNAYREAEKISGAARRQIERTAWEGAHSRSTEEFIMHEQLDRAAAEIHAWQNEFPAAKIDGYLTLLYAKYWAARKKYDQAIAQAEQLAATNPDSPYADQILLLAVQCELKRGRKDRAIAALHSLVKDYPGSPLVPEANKAIAELERSRPEQPAKAVRPRGE